MAEAREREAAEQLAMTRQAFHLRQITMDALRQFVGTPDGQRAIDSVISHARRQGAEEMRERAAKAVIEATYALMPDHDVGVQNGMRIRVINETEAAVSKAIRALDAEGEA